MAVNWTSPLTFYKPPPADWSGAWVTSTDVFLSLCPSVWWTMLSLTTERPCLSFLAIASEEHNIGTICDTDWVWQRPWALGAVAEKRWSMATATRLAILVNWAVKQLGGASGVLWMVPKSFLALVNSVGTDSKCFLFWRYRSHSLERERVDTAWHVASRLHIQEHSLLLEKLIKESCRGHALSFLIIFSSQRPWWLPSLFLLSEQLNPLFQSARFQFAVHLISNEWRLECTVAFLDLFFPINKIYNT